MARDLTNAIIASPDQSSTIFGLGGGHPPRFKNLFIARFVKKTDTSISDGLSFFVKSITKPTVQPEVEELNQYNKKRIIHTGVKYNPVDCILYDTADGAAMNMWIQYAKYYFGDYNQNIGSFSDDILNDTINKSSSRGYGYNIASASSSEPDGINSQYFFDRIEVYQVWGNEYTLYSLMNPRINNFAPDELDYEQSAASMINMTIQYEAIYHENDGKPIALQSNQILTSLFGAEFSGHTYDPSGMQARTSSFVSSSGASSQTLSSINNLLGNTNISGTTFPSSTDLSQVTNSANSALSKFGSFNFGNFSTLSSALSSEISSLTKSDSVQSIFGGNISNIPDLADATQYASNVTGTSALDQAVFTVDTTSSLGDNLGYWTYDGDEESSQNINPATVDASVSIPKQPSKEGLVLSPLVLATVNAQSDGTSQLGYVFANNTTVQYLSEPTPQNYYIGMSSGIEQNDTLYATATIITP